MAERLDKLVRYFLTAGVASIVDVGMFAILCTVAVPVAPAATASFCIAAVANYLLSSRFAFHCAPSVQGFGLFFLAALGGLAVNVTVTSAGHGYLGIPPVPAKLTGIGTAFFLNFWVNFRVVFRPRPARPSK